MKGIVFNLAERCVSEEHGEDAWDQLLEMAGLEGAYTSLGDYPDAELAALLQAGSKMLSTSPDELERWLGESAMVPLAELYPEFFEGQQGSSSLIATLNDIIHPEVRKLYPGADVPVFRFEELTEARVTLGYQSARKMCSFAEGLIAGAANHFGERVSIEQTACMKRGQAECILVCTFTRVSNG